MLERIFSANYGLPENLLFQAIVGIGVQ